VSHRLSIIIPAFNEEKRLPDCLRSVKQALEDCDLETEVEIIVCDNNSTDGTGTLAREHGALVIFEPINQISRARNTGASMALADWLLFIDADSVLDARNLRSVLSLADQKEVFGGGCVIAFDHAPWWGRLMAALWNRLSLTMGWAAGSFIFCRRSAFMAVKGFGMDFYAAEEIDLMLRLRRWGRDQGQKAIILRDQPHISSGRKFYLYSPWEGFKMMTSCLLLPWRTFRRKEALDYFYDGRR
jgi:glycosyltransferase involved in cell wall biosynthesis